MPPDLSAPPQPPDNREAAASLGHAMKGLHRHISSRVMRGMQAELVELDLSFSQMTALHVLRARSSMTVTALSERTHLSLPAASHLVERLVQRGLAQREENPENRREKVVRITQAGLDVLNGMDSGFVRAYQDTFAALPPELIRATTAHLNTLLSALEPGDLDPSDIDSSDLEASVPPSSSPQEHL